MSVIQSDYFQRRSRNIPTHVQILDLDMAQLTSRFGYDGSLGSTERGCRALIG